MSPSDICLKIDDTTRPTRFLSPYLLNRGGREPQHICIEFPMRLVRTTESIFYKEYAIDRVGDQIVGMSPEPIHLPMFP